MRMSNRLAYVFWHWPRKGAKGYERRLTAFHAALRSHPPEGLLQVTCFRESRGPWKQKQGTTYEDWYVVDGFAALGLLNEAAVKGANRAPHDEVAEEALGGEGGVFLKKRGSLPLEKARYATWVSKPPQMGYEDFFREVAGIAAENSSDLWQRQMVLGPSKEFCIHSDDLLEIPKRFGPLALPLTPVWKGPA